MKQAAQLLDAGITDSVLIAERIGVHERTVHRYLHELEGGVDRRAKGRDGAFLQEEVKPLVLEHLRRYPHLRITAFEVDRALRTRTYTSVRHALASLERDGLVRHEIGARKKGCVKVILWSLAEPDEQ